ncbi:MAG: flagellar export protein FliJ [Schwartzia sp. (in: firmicutes)]
MKKFRFKLEKYLDVTRRRKDEAERRFAEASRRLEEARERLGQLLVEMAQGQKDYADLISEGKRITVGTLMTYNSFFNWKRQQIEQQQQTILECQAAKQKCLQELMKIMNRLKSIEQLKEKRLQEYKDALQFEENKLLDEIGLQLYMRRSRQEEHA